MLQKHLQLITFIAFLRSINCYFIDFHTGDGHIFANGQEFYIKGINWFGFETKERVLQGIWAHATTMDRGLDLLKKNNFNTVRIPLALDSVEENPVVPPDQVSGQPELKGKRYLDILDIFINKCAQRSMLVLLENHRLNAEDPDIPELWYSSGSAPNLNLLSAFDVLAERYCNSTKYWNVFAIDLKHEPHGQASWGNSSPATDWNIAATKIGNHIISSCQRWLIFVEGVQVNIEGMDVTAGQWGGSLQGVHNFPIQLNNLSKLVYSPHAYGPSSDPFLHWWSDNSFPKNLPAIWNEYFGFIPTEIKTPVVVGAWGANLMGKNGEWFTEFVNYLTVNKIGSFYWAFNPHSGDIDGLVGADWRTPNKEKLALLDSLPATDVKVFVDSFSDCPDGSCLGNGNCNADGKCECYEGWFGHQCEHCTVDDKISCNSGGMCNKEDTCSCYSAFNGTTCETEVCAGIDCGTDLAACVAENGIPECFCQQGCAGNQCTKCSSDGKAEAGLIPCEQCTSSEAHNAKPCVFYLLLILAYCF